MRVAHVVTYVSTDGAFGGPVAVAKNDCEELARRGHSVDLIAAWDGKVEFDIPGVRTLLFRASRVTSGVGGVVSPRLLRYLRNHVGEYDVVHVHLGRDLVTAPSALLASRRTRLVIQTHGMIVPDERLRSRVFDLSFTRRILRRTSTALSLMPAETEALAAISPAIRGKTREIRNGVPHAIPTQNASPEHRGAPTILFLARLHPRKGVMVFAEAARLLIQAGKLYNFEIVGPDEGDAKPLQDFIAKHDLTSNVIYRGPIPPGESIRYMANAHVYVLPSRNEIVPMTVLEAMSAGTPTVMSDDCGLAQLLTERHAAIVCAPKPEVVAGGIQSLIEDTKLRESVQNSAWETIRDVLSIGAVVNRLEAIYAEV